MDLRRREVLSSITAFGIGAGTISTTAAGSETPTESLGSGATTASTAATQSSCVRGQPASLTGAEARFLSKHAALRADLFEQFARGFEDPKTDESDFLPGFSDIVGDFLGFGSNADENPNVHQPIRQTKSSFDDVLIGQVGLYSDLAFISMGYSPIVGNLIELIQKLQWFKDVAEKSSLQQVFNQGIQGCDTCSPGGRGKNGDAAETARQTNKRLARRARQTAEAARAFRTDPSSASANRIVDQLAAERRAGADISTIRAWSTINPNDYSIAAAGTEKAKAVRKLASVNALAVRMIRKIQCSQLDTLTSDEELPIPSAIEAYNANIDSLREQVPGYAFNRVTNQSGNLLVTKSGEGNVRTTSALGFRIGSDGLITNYSLTPWASNFDVYVDHEAVQLLKGGVTEQESARLSNMDAVRIEGNGFIGSVKYGAIDLFASELFSEVVSASSNR